MSTETAPELEIPDAAFTALHEAGDEPMRDYVRAITAPVVAAELRRLADTFMDQYNERERKRLRRESESGKPRRAAQHFNSAVAQAAQALFARADELDGGHRG